MLAIKRLCCDDKARIGALKILVFVLALLPTITISTRGQAQNYPWCAVLNMGDATYNCGFETREQCMATVHGTGGQCERNTQYVPDRSAPNSPKRQSIHRDEINRLERMQSR